MMRTEITKYDIVSICGLFLLLISVIVGGTFILNIQTNWTAQQTYNKAIQNGCINASGLLPIGTIGSGQIVTYQNQSWAYEAYGTNQSLFTHNYVALCPITIKGGN